MMRSLHVVDRSFMAAVCKRGAVASRQKSWMKAHPLTCQRVHFTPDEAKIVRVGGCCAG